ncbi:MAG: DUF6491 family protein [Rudaea sp.]
MRKRFNGTTVFLSAAVGLFATNLASADTQAHQAEELARFQRYAGAPVDEFRMVDVFQTQIVGARNVVVWPRVNQAYLVTVDKTCAKLEWAHGFSITQEMSMKVTKQFDFIEFDHQRCKITEIEPIDYKAMLKDDKTSNQPVGGT